MVETVFSTQLGESALVFVIVFVLVFAILQKSKILGDGKKQIDALVSLAMGLIVISVGYAVDLISNLIPFLAVSLVIILVFLLLVGFFHKEGFEAPSWMKMTAIVVAFIAVLVAVLYFTPAWDYISEVYSSGGSNIFSNVIIIVIVLIILAVLVGSSSGKKE